VTVMLFLTVAVGQRPGSWVNLKVWKNYVYTPTNTLFWIMTKP